jgi:hemoglobin/transferrin/lactoferrin receptor protein
MDQMPVRAATEDGRMDFLFPLAAAALALPTPLPTSPLVPEHHERILVTSVASRAQEQVDATPASVTIIERRDLERALARDVREALRHEPGISVENGPARFGLGNITIRGLDGPRVLMTVDGVRVPEGYRVGSFSNASRNLFDTSLVQRMELLRGPASALHGSDALGGVLAVTTVDPRDFLSDARSFGGSAATGYHEADDAFHAGGILAARGGPLELLAGVHRSDGHERETMGTVGGTGNTRTVANPQDTRSVSWLAKAVLPRADGGFVRATYDGYERHVATDVLSLNPQSPRTVSLAGDDHARRERASVDGVAYALGPVDRLSLLAYAQRSATRQDTVEVRANTTAACLSAAGNLSCRREARFTLDQDEAGISVVGESAPGGHRLVYGVDASRGEIEELRDGRQTRLDTGATTNVVGTDIFPTRDFPRSRVARFGTFVQDELALGGVTWIPALRYDRFSTRPRDDADFAAANPGRTPVSTTDSAWSPKLGLRAPLTPALEATLQAATGFRAPPFFDVNVGLSNLPLGYTVIPNPDLRPEKSRGLEAGLRGRHGALRWTLVAHRTDYRDLIVSRTPLPCPGDPRCVPTAPITFQSQNVTRARIEGLEARAEASLGAGWSARLGAAATRGDDRSRGVPLNSVDPAKGVASLAWEGRAWGRKAGFDAHLTHAARKTRIDATAGVLFATPAFTVADLSAFAEVAPGLTLHAAVNNLGDRKHWLWSDVRGVLNPGASIDRYTQPGRAFALGLAWRF